MAQTSTILIIENRCMLMSYSIEYYGMLMGLKHRFIDNKFFLSSYISRIYGIVKSAMNTAKSGTEIAERYRGVYMSLVANVFKK